MRVLGHNGEINTLLGNVNWMKARESAKGTPIASEFDLEEDVGGGEEGAMAFDPSCDIRDLVDAANTEKNTKTTAYEEKVRAPRPPGGGWWR